MDAARASMLEVLAFVEAELARGADAIELDVLDPDEARGHYPGETVRVDASAPPLIHRPWRTWLELAERLSLRMGTPRPSEAHRLRLRFEPLTRANLVRGGEAGTEKYGTDTDFARIHKLEDPGFVVDVREALERVTARRSREEGAPATRVLYLGCNTGDEIVLVRATCPALAGASHVGVDHSASAIAAARARFASEPSISFYEADLATVAPALGRFDLIVAIGTLQSPDIDDRQLLRTLVQDHLVPHGAVLLGLPNCRYVDGEVEYGARMKNFRQPELGLLLKDVAFYRKYLQQHHKQVFVTGKHYLLVTAVHIAGE